MKSGESAILGLLVGVPLALAGLIIAAVFYVGAVILESLVPKPGK